MSEVKVVYVDSDLEDLVPEFLENRQRDVENIAGLLQKGQLQEIQRLGHSMKGAGGGYGFNEISEIGRELEHAAKSGDQKAVSRLNKRLKTYLSSVKVVFRDQDLDD